MFFIYCGSVEIVSEEGGVVFSVMKEGQFFGEISLFFDCPRTASIRAANNCDLFLLSKADLYDALSHYPHIEQQILAVASKRATLAKKRSLITAQAKAVGMSPTNAAKVAAIHTQEEEETDDIYYHPTSKILAKKSQRELKKDKKGM